MKNNRGPMKRVLSILTLGFLSPLAYNYAYADGKGNGGDAVVCYQPDGRIEHTELYDYFEGRAKGWGFEIDFGEEHFDYIKMVDFALGRFAKTDPVLSRGLANEFEVFKSNQVLVPGTLVAIPDIDPDVLPEEKNCQIEQLAIRSKPRVPQDKIYKISRRLWEHLSDTNRAGLAMHEIIYHYAKKHGHANSGYARYLNNVLSSQSGVSSLTLEGYLALMKKINLPPMSVVIDHIVMSPRLRFHADVVDAAPLFGQNIFLPQNRGRPAAINTDRYITFYAKSKKLKSIWLAGTNNLTFNGIAAAWPSGDYRFYENGILETFNVTDPETKLSLNVDVFGNPAQVSSGFFGEDGAWKSMAAEFRTGEFRYGKYYLTRQAKVQKYFLHFERDGSLQNLSSEGRQPLELRSQKAPCTSQDDQTACIIATTFAFNKNGGLEKARGPDVRFSFHQQGCWSQNFVTRSDETLNTVSFYPNGMPAEAVSCRAVQTWNCRPYIQTCARGHGAYIWLNPAENDYRTMQFHESGVAKGGVRAANALLNIGPTESRTFYKGCYVVLDANGFGSSTPNCVSPK